MDDVLINKILNETDKLQHVYIHRKNKNYIIITVIRNKESGNIEYQCLASENGLTGIPINTEIFAIDLLPIATNNIFTTAASLSKYLNKNGYRGVTKITQTKNGVKLS